ncbi:ABC transporter permease subunit [Beduinella massiliensis]|uniref:ABC transporter permease subunit n=1 Tax=Beduinella massiliensis TaxID=1852363 RepID=UPI000C82B217
MVNPIDWIVSFFRDEIFVVYTPLFFKVLGEGLMVTLKISLCTIVISFLAGSALAIMRNSKNPVAHWIATIYVETVRNIPLLFFITMMVFFSPFPSNKIFNAILAMSIFTSGVVAEIVRGGLNGVPKGQWEAASSQGFGTFQAMVHVILPQAYRRILAPMIAQFVTTIKDTSFCAVLAMGDLYDRAKQAINQLNLRDHTAMVYVTVALVYFVVCFTFTNIAKRVQRSTYVIK